MICVKYSMNLELGNLEITIIKIFYLMVRMSANVPNYKEAISLCRHGSVGVKNVRLHCEMMQNH